MPRAPYTAPGHARTQPTPPAAKAQVRALLDTIVHEAAALPDSYVASLNPILRQAQAELSADLQRWLSKVPDGQERFTAQQYRTALLQLNSAMETLEKRLGGPHGAMAGTLIAQGAGAGAMAMSHLGQEVAAFSTVFGHGLRPVQLNQAAILAKGDDLLIPRYRNSAARYGADMTAEIRQQLAIGMARGETFAAMTDRLVRLRGPTGMVSLRGLQGSPAAYHEHIAEGLFVRYRHWAERIVRTEGLHAYNVHTDNGISELEAEDPGWVKRWDSTVDKRGCDICRGLDGKFADVKPAKKRKPIAPAPEPKPEDVLPADLRAPSKDEKKQAREAEKKRKAEEKRAIAEAKRLEQERLAAERAARPPGGQWLGAKSLAEGRRQLQAEIEEAYSLAPQEWRQEREKVVRRSLSGANGEHQWSGAIALDPKIAASLDDAMRVAPEHREAWLRRVGGDGSAPVRVGAGQVAPSFQHIRAAETLVHEAIHGYGALTAKNYEGAGTIVEEVATEAIARRYMSDRMGVPRAVFWKHFKDAPGVQSIGGYAPMMNELVEGLAHELGVPVTEAVDVLDQASIEFKRLRVGSANDGNEMLDRFVACLPEKARAGMRKRITQRQGLK